MSISNWISTETQNFTVNNYQLGEELYEMGIIQPTKPGLPPIFYSLFLPYSDKLNYKGGYTIDTFKKTYTGHFYNNSIVDLYRSAFTDHKNHLNLYVEIANPELALIPSDGNLLDSWKRKYMFSYELRGPLSKFQNCQQIMLLDLNRFLGETLGIEGLKEKRKINSYVLVKLNKGFLNTAGGKEMNINNGSLFKIRNEPFSELTELLYFNLTDRKNKGILVDGGKLFIDESGIDQKLPVDIQLIGDLKNIANLKNQLKNYGLDIIEAERDVDVWVIRDRK